VQQLGSIGGKMANRLFFTIASGLVGIFLILGTILKMRVLVDPPEGRKGNTSTFIMQHFGKTALIVFNYVLGSLFLIMAILIFISHS
jgi:hypothetical protein